MSRSGFLGMAVDHRDALSACLCAASVYESLTSALVSCACDWIDVVWRSGPMGDGAHIRIDAVEEILDNQIVDRIAFCSLRGLIADLRSSLTRGHPQTLHEAPELTERLIAEVTRSIQWQEHMRLAALEFQGFLVVSS